MLYLISYDLIDKPESEYKKLFDEIQLCGESYKVLSCQWVVSTEETADNVYNRLCNLISKNDKLLVFEMGKSKSGWVEPDFWEWINSR